MIFSNQVGIEKFMKAIEPLKPLNHDKYFIATKLWRTYWSFPQTKFACFYAFKQFFCNL